MSLCKWEPAGASIRVLGVSQGVQLMEQSERSYKHIHTQHFKSRAQQSWSLFQPVPPVSTFLVHSNPSCHVDPKS